MIKNAFSSFKISYKYLFRDKINLFLALIPIVVGVMLYYFLGKTVFFSLMNYGQEFISEYVKNSSVGSVLGFIVGAILSVLLYFIINWTFVLIVSVIASPFNNILSSRIEKTYLGETLPTFNETINESFSNFLGSIFNEIKKISFILGLSVLAVVIGFIPILTPISLVIGALVLSSEFLDFSWGRHSISFKKVKLELRTNFLSYFIGGSFFMFIVSLPIVNILVPSWGTSYFTILWVKNNESSN